MLNLVRVGKELAGPVFPHPLKSKGCRYIHKWVRLALILHRWLTICTTVFPYPVTFWTRLMFNLVRVGKEWAGPVGSQTQWWPRHKAIYFSWFGPELSCLLFGPPGFNSWFSFAPVVLFDTPLMIHWWVRKSSRGSNNFMFWAMIEAGGEVAYP